MKKLLLALCVVLSFSASAANVDIFADETGKVTTKTESFTKTILNKRMLRLAYIDVTLIKPNAYGNIGLIAVAAYDCILRRGAIITAIMKKQDNTAVEADVDSIPGFDFDNSPHGRVGTYVCSRPENEFLFLNNKQEPQSNKISI